MVLDSVESALNKDEVAAVVLEPMNTTTGHSCSPSFASELSQLAKSRSAAFVVDETNTGCGSTGSYWASEKWEMDDIDYLTFGNRTQVSGFYSSKDSAKNAADLANGCDPLKLEFLKVIHQVMEKDNLISKVDTTGHLLRQGVEKVLKEKAQVRGEGTSLYIETGSEETA